MSQDMYKHKATKIVDEIFSKQKFIFIEKQEAKTVGAYLKKHKAKCLQKFTNS